MTCFGTLTASSAAAGPVVYVDQDSRGGRCSDARTADAAGTPATPLCSLSRGLAVAQAGTTVTVRAATYPATSVKDVSPASLVTVQGQPGERPVLKGLTVDRCAHLAFTNLTLQSSRITNCDDVTFSDSDFTTSGAFSAFTTRLTYSRIRVHDAAEGLVIDDARGAVIEGSDFRNLTVAGRTTEGGDAIQGARSQDVVIRDNAFVDLAANPKGHADSIEFTYSNSNVRVERNVFRNCRGPVVTAGNGGPKAINANWAFVNNEFTKTRTWALQLQAIRGLSLVNNTVWGSGSAGVRLTGGAYGSVVAGNVIDKFATVATAFRASPDGKTPAGLEDYNLIGSGPRKGAHDLAGRPTFVNETAFDYRLQPTSPGIDAANSTYAPPTDLTGAARFDQPAVVNRGAGPVPYVDMGAYETR